MISPFEQTHQVSIRGSGPAVTVALDGYELRSVTRAVLTLDAEARVPVLELSLIVLNDLETGVPAHVVLDKSAHAGLVAMGWAPPETAVSPRPERQGAEAAAEGFSVVEDADPEGHLAAQ